MATVDHQVGGAWARSVVGADSLRAGNAPAMAMPRTQRLSRGLKLVLDVLLATLLLVLLAPILLLVALLIQVESPGTPLYRARRVGYRGEPLDVLKFRKMHRDARGLPLTLSHDERLTRIGRFMARTRVDEIPQLWNVVRGQMSLVGPRPEDPRFVALHPEGYARILSVRPGITGWSQLAFADESRILDPSDPVRHYVDSILPAKVQLDCKYAERTRLQQDLATLLWTAVAMILRVEIAVHRDSGHLGRRRRRAAAPAVLLAAAAAPGDHRARAGEPRHLSGL
jgi:lipopolysaccharide/colanic/teichoic acid biosynthesis glycosyltransferase